MDPIHAISNLRDKDKIAKPIPVTVAPQQKMGASTIESYSVTKPELDAPVSPNHRFVYCLLELEKLQKSSNERGNNRLEKKINAFKDIEEKDLEIFEKKFAAEASANNWSRVRDMSSAILSAFTLYSGYSLIQEAQSNSFLGPFPVESLTSSAGSCLLGALLVGSSILSIANVAMQHAPLWKSLSDKLPLSEESKKNTSLTISSLLTATTLMTLPLAHFAKGNPVEGIFQTFTQGLSGFSSMKTYQANRQNTLHNTAILGSQFQKEQIKRAIQEIAQGIKNFNEQHLTTIQDAREIIELNDQSVQWTLQV